MYKESKVQTEVKSVRDYVTAPQKMRTSRNIGIVMKPGNGNGGIVPKCREEETGMDWTAEAENL